MTKTGLAYLLECASFADKEAREKTDARIKPLLDAANNVAWATWSTIDDYQGKIGLVVTAIDGDQAARVSLGMEKGE